MRIRFNRNIVECKERLLPVGYQVAAGFNRNIVECKVEVPETPGR